MRKKCKCFTPKSQLNTKDNNAGNGQQKVIRHMETQRKTELSPFLSVITLNINLTL